MLVCGSFFLLWLWRNFCLFGLGEGMVWPGFRLALGSSFLQCFWLLGRTAALDLFVFRVACHLCFCMSGGASFAGKRTFFFRLVWAGDLGAALQET